MHLVFLAVIVRIFIRVLFSCDIPYKTTIGKNCKFPHLGLGVLLHSDCIIGDNCTISHNVTIGGKSGGEILPIIGNNVVIGAGAIVIGNVKVGDNSIIGAGSVVVKDVQKNSVVVGNPAKKIKDKK